MEDGNDLVSAHELRYLGTTINDVIASDRAEQDLAR